MEPETIKQKDSEMLKISQLHKVTPLSKYLAMLLLITTPFIGGWIGYNYAPEKVVEKDVFINKEIVLNDKVISQVQLDLDASKKIFVSVSKINDWLIYRTNSDSWNEEHRTYFDANTEAYILGNEILYTHEPGRDLTNVSIQIKDENIDTVKSQLFVDRSVTETVFLDQKSVLKISNSSELNDCVFYTYLHKLSASLTGVVKVPTCPTHPEEYDKSKILVAESVKFWFFE